MITVTELEQLALVLPEAQRAILAQHLLGSLSPVLHDDDDGIAEALRRDADFDADPAVGMSVQELDQLIARHDG